MANYERWTKHTRSLPPLFVGDHVRIQNQIGNHPTRWNKTGAVIEVCQYHQYVIRVDGSGRVTIRNHKFLRKYTPVRQPDRCICILYDLKYLPVSNPSDHSFTLTILADVPIQPNVPLSSDLPEAFVPPSSVDQHLPTAQPIPPCSPGSSSEPSTTTTPTITSSPSISPPQILGPQASAQPPPAELEPPSINLRRSIRIRKP